MPVHQLPGRDHCCRVHDHGDRVQQVFALQRAHRARIVRAPRQLTAEVTKLGHEQPLISGDREEGIDGFVRQLGKHRMGRSRRCRVGWIHVHLEQARRGNAREHVHFGLESTQWPQQRCRLGVGLQDRAVDGHHRSSAQEGW